METDIDILRSLCNNKAIKWTEHIALRMLKRQISRRQVIAAIQTGEIIEQYPDDTPYPSCLVLGRDTDGQSLHVVCGSARDSIWMITAYYPDSAEWEDDLKTRRAAK